jgi:hypothetical protein
MEETPPASNAFPAIMSNHVHELEPVHSEGLLLFSQSVIAPMQLRHASTIESSPKAVIEAPSSALSIAKANCCALAASNALLTTDFTASRAPSLHVSATTLCKPLATQELQLPGCWQKDPGDILTEYAKPPEAEKAWTQDPSSKSTFCCPIKIPLIRGNPCTHACAWG